MKRALVLILSIVMVMSFSTGAFAAESSQAKVDANKFTAYDVNQLTRIDINDLKRQVKSMSNYDFDNFVAKYIGAAQVDQFEDVVEVLNKLDIEVNKPTREYKSFKKTASTKNKVTIAALGASYCEVTITSAKRSGESFYRIISTYGIKDDGKIYQTKEEKPGTYDVIGVFFDPSYFSYYGNNNSSGSRNSLKDTSQKDSGTILFNAYDQYMVDGETDWVAVYATKKASGAAYYATKWTHTWSTKSTSSSNTASVTFGGPGIISGTIGYSVTTTDTEGKWEIMADNFLNL
jgi:hypothetical protein